MVFLDLEDACAPAERESARGKAAKALRELDWGHTTRAIRMNGVDTRWAYGDVIDVVTDAREALQTIIVPKVRRARDVWWVDTLLTQVEETLGLPPERDRARGADRGDRGAGERRRDRPVVRPAGGGHLRRRGLLRVAGGPGRHELRPGRRLPRGPVALRALPDRRRRTVGGRRRDRRAVPELPDPGRLPDGLRPGGRHGLHRQVGHPSVPGGASRTTRSPRPRTRSPTHVVSSPPIGRPRRTGWAPPGSTGCSSTPPTCATPRPSRPPPTCSASSRHQEDP